MGRGVAAGGNLRWCLEHLAGNQKRRAPLLRLISVRTGRIVRRFHPVEAAWVVRERVLFPPRRPLRSYGTGGGPWRRTMRREGGLGIVSGWEGLVTSW